MTERRLPITFRSGCDTRKGTKADIVYIVRYFERYLKNHFRQQNIGGRQLSFLFWRRVNAFIPVKE